IVKYKTQKLYKTDYNKMINYINQKNNQSRYQKQIEEIKNTIDNGTQSDSTLGKIKDKNGKPIVTISKDGVSSFIFKQLAFTPHYHMYILTVKITMLLINLRTKVKN